MAYSLKALCFYYTLAASNAVVPNPAFEGLVSFKVWLQSIFYSLYHHFMNSVNHMLHVLIAHPAPAFCRGISELIAPGRKNEKPVCAHNGSGVIDLLLTNRFSLLFLDDRGSGTSGSNLLSFISGRFPLVKIIMLTVSDNTQHIRSLFAAGASGCIHHRAAQNEYARAVKSVAANEKFICSCISQLLLKENGDPLPQHQSAGEKAKLSSREFEIFPYLLQKMPQQKIADTLFISLDTVKNHRKSIRKKLAAAGLLYLLDNPFLSAFPDFT